MDKILELYKENRKWRSYYRQNLKLHTIEAAACAIRETALLDAMSALGLSAEERRRLEK
jgi:hypothetical protein